MHKIRTWLLGSAFTLFAASLVFSDTINNRVTVINPTSSPVPVLITSPIPITASSASPLPVTCNNCVIPSPTVTAVIATPYPTLPVNLVSPATLSVHEIAPVPTQTVSVVNFPAPNQSIAVTNFPTPVPTQSVVQASGANLHVNVDAMPAITVSPVPTQTVAVVNFPSPVPTQTVAGTVMSDLQSGSGTPLTSTGGYLDTEVHGFPTTLACTQSAPPWSVSQSGTWSTGRTWNLNSSTDSVDIGNYPTSQTVNGTVNANLQSGLGTTISATGTYLDTQLHGSITANLGTLNGAATAANQVTGNTNLATISGQLPSSLGAKTTANSLAVNVASDQTVSVSASALPLPSGAATSALQVSGNSTLSSIQNSVADIDTKTPALGQALSSASVPVVLPAAQITTLTPPTTITANQGGTWNINNISGTVSLPTGAATATGVAAVVTALGSPFQAGGSIGNTGFSINGTLPAFATTPTFNLGTLNGAATSALQTTGNTALSAIQTSVANIPAQGQALSAASLPVVLPAAQITALTPPTSISVSNFPATQLVSAASLPLPSGAATSALQTTGNSTLSTIATNTTNAGTPTVSQSTAANLNATVVGSGGAALATSANQATMITSLGSIVTNTTGAATAANQATIIANQTNGTQVVQTKAPVLANGSLSATQTLSTTESTVAAPANAVGCIFESDSLNSTNARWGFSNSTTAILSTTKGILMEPGRLQSTPFGAGTYLHLIAVSGTPAVNVQWVLSQ